MALISYYLLLKLDLLFNPRNSIWGFIALILMIVIAVLYGKGVSELLNGNLVQFDEAVVELIKNGIIVFIAVFTFIRGFFPSYKPVRSYFKVFHPIKSWMRFILNYLSDFISLYFLAVGSFIFSVVYFSTSSNLEYIFLLIVSLVGAHMVRRSFQTLIENSISISFLNLIYIVISIAIVSISIVSFVYNLIPIVWSAILLMFGLTLFAFTVEEKSTIEEVNATKKSEREGGIIPFNLLLKNKFVRTPLVFGYFFKIIILILDIVIYSKSGTHFGNNLIVVFLFASPLILFTYIFNNIWGYFKNYWYIIDQSISQGERIFKMYLYVLWLPVSIDFIISISYFSLNPSGILLEGLIMYFVSLIVLTIGGFYWSMSKPTKVEQGLSFKVNTTILGSISSIIIVSSFMLLFFSSWFYLIVPFYLISSFMVYKHLVFKYNHKRFCIYNNLFKG